jgi:predicted dinucleotide-binding enzyme|tara:strand:- start:6 stop:194 length:189 start_codon:yes stop_codon:yes gene_type:complete
MEFFKEYKDKPTKEILDVMKVLKTEFDKTKNIIIDLTNHLESIERKFNTLDKEIDKRNNNGG